MKKQPETAISVLNQVLFLRKLLGQPSFNMRKHLLDDSEIILNDLSESQTAETVIGMYTNV
jgi:hypothetical protein|tara:strand:- start:374 stop:556 length:183 start_codon:yes stop_codon:yes gene_type:complete